MILNHVRMINGNGDFSIGITGDKISSVSSSAISCDSSLQLNFDDALIFPGLINSHDHLDFNLYPQLGNKFYNNYTEWGRYIHTHHKAEINEILKIPVALRSRWGVFKNLLCGVTTVINHGEPSGLPDDLITIFEKAHSLHSVQFDKKWKLRLNNPLKINTPVAIHVGEGNDALSHKEIDRLIWWNLLKRELIGIHGVAMTTDQAEKFRAVVWCPQSNYFLLNKTAPVNLLETNTDILFGTDSTLTSHWDIWEHIRMAHECWLLSETSLFNALTKTAATTWQLNSGEISTGKTADLVVAKAPVDKLPIDAFFEVAPADILLVIHQGNIRLFDESLLSQLNTIDLSGFSKIKVNGAIKYVQGDLPGLMQEIRAYNDSVTFPVSIN